MTGPTREPVKTTTAGPAAGRGESLTGAVNDPAGAAVFPHLLQIGRRIRALRQSRGLTLSELSERTGISVSMLSMVERGQANPTVGTLIAVAAALEADMADLFGVHGAERASPVTRRDEQRVVRAATGFTRRLLVHDRARGIEMVLNRYEPGAHSNPVPSKHHGYEFGVVLSGCVHVELDGKVYRLEEGDAIAYPSTTPHRSWNEGEDVATTVWVNLWNF
ncbi:MAG TPA: cupin domain-containing protein [Thermaerobacter sp.]